MSQAPKMAAIWGSKGHARVVGSLLRGLGVDRFVLFDNDPAATSALEGAPLHVGEAGFEAFCAAHDVSGMIGCLAIGGARGSARTHILDLFARASFQLPALVHPRAYVCETATLGRASQVLTNATVASHARLGDGCIINHNAVVDHDTIIGNGVHLAPSATLCGEIVVEDHVFVGAGATVLPRLKIGKDAIIAAGAVVVADVGRGTTVVGVPARPVPTRYL